LAELDSGKEWWKILINLDLLCLKSESPSSELLGEYLLHGEQEHASDRHQQDW
jgi:hypothetical protein